MKNYLLIVDSSFISKRLLCYLDRKRHFPLVAKGEGRFNLLDLGVRCEDKFRTSLFTCG
ncbi:hypothetical protein BACI348_51135 [Bacillus altitudinis]|uniref:Uncharacterized protein n=1 Tax=Bacillus altitudinis TaxID=293387 RepID=A0A653YGD6_BACAB|nr:hypothetical protein BACI348_51135 [Bacillus altitudinis]